MLSGWVMTDVLCAVAECGMIAFRKKDSSVEKYCCLCNDPTEPIPVSSVTEPVEDEVSFELLETVDVHAEKGPEQQVSNLIGEKLLQGWTMMADSCPDCRMVPLMRDREMKLHCFSCATNVNAEETKDFHPAEESMSAKTYKSKELRDETSGISTVISGSLRTSLSATLVEKLKFLEQRLDSSNYPKEIQQISNAIESVLSTLKSIQKIQ